MGTKPYDFYVDGWEDGCLMALRKCTHCKDRFPKESMIIVPVGAFCTFDHLNQYQYSKRKKAAEKAFKAETNKLREKVRDNDSSWQKQQTQQVFNKMRVLEELLWFQERGLEPTCISCGGELGGDQWCCGHLKTVGAQGVLRYDRGNTKLQHNRRCNMGLSGDIYGTKTTHGYIQGLHNRFGQEEAERVIKYVESTNQPKSWAIDELKQIRKDSNKRIRELKKQLETIA